MKKLKNTKKMTKKEIEKEMIRNSRMLNIYAKIPIEYNSNTDLDENKKKFYMGLVYFEMLCNMIVDNIKIEQISEYLKMSQEMLLSFIKNNNLVIK